MARTEGFKQERIKYVGNRITKMTTVFFKKIKKKRKTKDKHRTLYNNVTQRYAARSLVIFFT